MPLEKATLTRLSGDREAREVGEPIKVQFNPGSLRLSLSNQVEGGNTLGRQVRQFNGKSSTELSFDLHFDTADESGPSPSGARSVRERTAEVEQFVVPAPDPEDRGRRLMPPRVRFQWGDLKIDGLISSLQVDFDLFASDGTPLRAKMGVSIKEQDARYEIKQGEQGEGVPPPPPPGGSAGAAPGSAGGGLSGFADRTAEALAGESAAEFAARVGLDPSAWRGVAAGLEGTLSLEAGLAIDFDSSISVGLGVGVTVGVEAGVSASLEARLGLETRGSASASAGFVLSAAGGVEAALQTATALRSEAAATVELQAFALPAGPVPRSTLEAPPEVDPRSGNWGFGIPLRPRQVPAATAQRGRVSLSASEPRARATVPPTTPPWARPLPAVDSIPCRAPRRARGCGCGRGCRGAGCR